MGLLLEALPVVFGVGAAALVTGWVMDRVRGGGVDYGADDFGDETQLRAQELRDWGWSDERDFDAGSDREAW